jgi:hypothetical protein
MKPLTATQRAILRAAAANKRRFPQLPMVELAGQPTYSVATPVGAAGEPARFPQLRAGSLKRIVKTASKKNRL